MSLWMMGNAGAQAPFNRTFFNVSLGEILEHSKGEKNNRLTLYLVDGPQLDVRAIEELSDYYMSVRASVGGDDSSKYPLHVVPYGAIYRIEVDDRADEENRRLGFQWTPLEVRSRQARRSRPKGEFPSVTGETPSPERGGTPKSTPDA